MHWYTGFDWPFRRFFLWMVELKRIPGLQSHFQLCQGLCSLSWYALVCSWYCPWCPHEITIVDSSSLCTILGLVVSWQCTSYEPLPYNKSLLRADQISKWLLLFQAEKSPLLLLPITVSCLYWLLYTYGLQAKMTHLTPVSVLNNT